jgi:acyl-CoA synthetase (NDP forming)
MMRSADGAQAEGVLMQPMTEDNVELVIGLQNDALCGAIITVGLGGIPIEVLKGTG